MKTIQVIGLVLLVGAGVAVVVAWQKVAALRAENEGLRNDLEAAKSQNASTTEAQSQKRAEELRRQQAQTEELARLRGEVTQSRSSGREAEKLRAENLQLRQQNQQLPVAGNGGAAPVVDRVHAHRPSQSSALLDR